MSLGWRFTVRASISFLLALGVVFLPAGTWRWWQGWAFLAAYFVPAILIFAYFLRHDPALVERRLQTEERVREQRVLIRLSKPLFLAAFVLPGLDHRFGWSHGLLGPVPLWLTVFALVAIAGGFLFVFRVVRVNSFAGRTIAVVPGQRVISSGPYAVVRHPMYTGSIVLFLFTPLALDSWVALPLFALLIPFYAIRLLNEEKLLRAELPGYVDYCGRTPYRLIPFVW
jgi:protein-S-isoprenylcysteine O-methyltransferase Ste14